VERRETDVPRNSLFGAGERAVEAHERAGEFGLFGLVSETRHRPCECREYCGENVCGQSCKVGRDTGRQRGDSLSGELCFRWL
jgi:hypothetical protein